MRDDGFTLIEVLVALTILGMSLGVVLGAFSQSLARTEAGRREMAARTLAQTLLGDASASGEHSGRTADGLSWRLSAAPYAQPNDMASTLHAAIVTATIAWPDGGQTRTLSLRTLKLVSPP